MGTTDNHGQLPQGLALRTTAAGIEVVRADDSTPVALVYGDSKDSKALARVVTCCADLLYVLSRAYALSGLNSTDEGRALKRLIADVYKKAAGKTVDRSRATN
jgi:hypothetical protein